MMYDVVIIGAGPAGISAGIYAASRGKKVLITEKNTVGGLIGKVSTVTHYEGIMTEETGYSKELETKMHQTIKKVSSDYENLKYNTAIAAMMALINEFYKKNAVTKGEYETLLILLNPVAPHITEELWQIIGGTGYVYQQRWPEFDEAKTVENTVEIAVQINGKTKGTLAIGRNDAKDDVIAKAKESIADKLTGNIVKEIYVPGRIVNIVMK